MWYFPKVDLFEDYFQFDQLQYPVYRQFLELLEYPTSKHFLHTNKKHYKDGITFVGIDVNVHKRITNALLGLTHVSGSMFFATVEDYHKLEQKYSKFWPYLKFNRLVIDFNTCRGKTIDRGPIPVPKVYRKLVVWGIKQAVDIDYVVKEAVHPGVQNIVFRLSKMKLDEAMKLINYTLSKIPGLSEYCFIRFGKNFQEYRVRQLIKPPTSTREMTLDVGSTHIWYRQKETL